MTRDRRTADCFTQQQIEHGFHLDIIRGLTPFRYPISSQFQIRSFPTRFSIGKTRPFLKI